MTASQPRLLKADAARDLDGIAPFDFADIRRRCEAYVEQVRQQTQSMLKSAAAEAADIRRQAHEEGHRQGYQSGQAQAEQEAAQRIEQESDRLVRERVETALPALETAADALAGERDRWRAEWEAVAVKLASAIAGHVLRRELSRQPELALDMLRNALELAAGQPQIELHLHPRDLEQLGDTPQQVIQRLARCGSATLLPDESIEPGGCRITTHHGEIDARLQTQIDRITEELLD